MHFKVQIVLCSLLYFMAIFCTTAGDVVDTELIRNPDLKQEFEDSKLSCMKYFKSIFLKAFLIFSGKWNEPDGQKTESPMKCWISCILKKMKLMTRRNSTLDNDGINNMINKLSEKGQEKANKKLPMCLSATASITNSCDKGAAFVSCMYQGDNKANEL